MSEKIDSLSAIELESTGIFTPEDTRDAIPRKQKGGGLVWMVVAALIWGTVGVSSALMNRIESTPPMMIAFLRLGFASPFLLALTWFTTRRNPFKLNRREWFYYGMMGLAMAIYQVTYFFAIPMAGVTLVVVTALCSSPVMVALISIPVFKERLTGRTILALALGITGTVLLAFGGKGSSSGQSQIVLGAILALATGLAYSGLVVFSKLSVRDSKVDRGPAQPVAVAFTISAILLLVVSLATGNFKLDMAVGVWLIGAYLGLVPTGVAYVLFFRGMVTTSATAAAIITMLEPAVAAILSFLLLQEQLSGASLVGSVLLLASVFVLSKK